MKEEVHFEASVLNAFASPLRRREPGTKLAFNYRPVLFICYVIFRDI